MKNRFSLHISAAVLGLVLLLSGCGGTSAPAKTADPHEHMVEVPSGIGDNTLWVWRYDNLKKNLLDPARFYSNGDLIGYSGTDYRAAKGIDVSEHQQIIDFEAVKADGIEYVIVRAGYRGYTEGGLNKDHYFDANVSGALAAGLDVGIYFFSQAKDAAEAEEEADFLIDLLNPYQGRIALPVFFDWETVDAEGARSEGILEKGITGMTKAFCAKIEEAGYTPGVYASRTVAYYSMDLESINDAGITLWINAIAPTPDFYYEHEFWQYSVTGTVSGISTEVDLDLRFISAESLGVSEQSDTEVSAAVAAPSLTSAEAPAGAETN